MCASDSIHVLHNAQRFHQILLLCQNRILAFRVSQSSNLLGELSKVTELSNMTLKVRISAKVTCGKSIWLRVWVVGPKIIFDCLKF